MNELENELFYPPTDFTDFRKIYEHIDTYKRSYDKLK